jgi:hypothetical protein
MERRNGQTYLRELEEGKEKKNIEEIQTMK